MELMFDKSPLANGLTLQNRYEVVQQLGRGGFGRTYLARDRHQRGEYCVLKEFAPQFSGSEELNKAKELFNREAGILYQLKHPQIPRFREMLTVSIAGTDSMFLVQDYVEGETYLDILDRYRKKGRVFSEEEVSTLLVQILPVLDYIHSQNAIHRDISPDNLIKRASDNLPVLIDFGGVKQAAVNAVSLLHPKRAVTRIGKPDYAPEEQLRKGEANPSSDLYSLGVTALVLLTGKEPSELYDSHGATWAWRSRANVSRSFATILERMVAYLPRDRYQSAAEVLQALQPNVPQVSQLKTILVSGRSPVNAKTSFGDTVIIPQPAKGAKGAILRASGAIFLCGLGVWGLWRANFLRLPANLPIFGSSPTKTEIALIEDLNQRRQALKMSEQDFNRQVDSEFYARHPNLKQRPLTNKTEDAFLRREWYAIGDRLLTRLEKQRKK